MANENFFGRMAALPGKRLDDFLQQTERYRRGEISLADQMLQGGANAVGMLTDVPLQVVGETVSMLTPEFMQKGLQDLSEGIMETDAAKAAMQYAQENPQVMKRLGYMADLSVIPGAKTSKGMLQDLSLEAANRQPWFYGSGKAGQVASVAATGLSTLGRTLSPRAAASRRGGIPHSVRNEAAISTRKKLIEAREKQKEPVKGKKAQKRLEEIDRIKNKKSRERTKEEKETLSLFNKDLKLQKKIETHSKNLSFLLGQLDQTQLINRGRGIDSQNVIAAFEKVQQLDGGVLDKNTFSTASSFSKDVTVNNIRPSAENLAVIEERVREAWKIKPTETVEVVIRDPKVFSDLSGEITSLSGTGSKEAKRIIHARKALARYYPEKETFTPEELLEFAALTRLPDDTLRKKKTGEKVSKLGEKWYWLTESKKYGTMGRTAQADIDSYYKYKKTLESGKKLTTVQRRIYDQQRAKIALEKENLDLRGDTVYLGGSHKSATKGLGGVNNQFMLNTKGDFLGFITDENDLFGITVPGDNRVLTVVPPSGFNIFKTTPDSPGLEKPQRKAYLEELDEQYGVEPRGETRQGMLEQAALAIQNQPRPNLRPADFKNLGAATALTVGASRER